MRRFVLTALLLIAVAGLILSCGNRGVDQVQTTAAEPEPAPVAEPTTPDTVLEMVELTAEGATFDPPIQAAQLPDGAWYCDMGTVHYACLEEGDGRCPECGMALVQKVAASSEEAVEGEGGESLGHEG